MEKVIITNSLGESLTFSHKPPLLLKSIDGTGSTEVSVQMQKSPYQDGQSYVDSLLEPRVIPITAEIKSKDVYKLRSTISKVLNPKLGVGTLTYFRGTDVKEIPFVVEQPPSFPSGTDNKGRTFQLVLFTLICPNPYWLDIDQITEPLIAWIGEFKFPLSLPTTMGRKGDSVTMINKGDVPTPVFITFNGPSDSPVVINHTTGEFIKINRQLGDGEKIEINTQFGNKKVEIVRQNGERINAFNWIDLDSTFFQLQVGANELEYTALSGTINANVQVSWKNRYIGL
ncbi:phage tail family protein [Sutcliffiella cohnii]|uniref:phage tail family protein n=1 Tax=Sutcliffiella cohnii TaxID=33932 RepID=UPI002E23814A|nr:phage tail family protein [Sutcliffiella cohnii]